VGQGLLASTLGLVLSEAVGPSWVVAGTAIGVASLTGLVLASRWIADLTAPAMGALTDRFGRRVAGSLYFLVGFVALVGAGYAVGPLWITALIFAFYLAATGVNVCLTAQAGLLGSRAVAAYVTASDLGSAVGPNLGWLGLQLGLSSDLVFGLGAGLYAIGAMAALRALGGSRPSA
jgi:hypothetical protein